MKILLLLLMYVYSSFYQYLIRQIKLWFYFFFHVKPIINFILKNLIIHKYIILKIKLNNVEIGIFNRTFTLVVPFGKVFFKYQNN